MAYLIEITIETDCFNMFVCTLFIFVTYVCLHLMQEMLENNLYYSLPTANLYTIKIFFSSLRQEKKM